MRTNEWHYVADLAAWRESVPLMATINPGEISFGKGITRKNARAGQKNGLNMDIWAKSNLRKKQNASHGQFYRCKNHWP